jgi:hypothetical protein
MFILAMSIRIASHAITMVNTIIDGTIMAIGIMAIGITIMAMDDRWREAPQHLQSSPKCP